MFKENTFYKANREITLYTSKEITGIKQNDIVLITRVISPVLSGLDKSNFVARGLTDWTISLIYDYKKIDGIAWASHNANWLEEIE